MKLTNQQATAVATQIFSDLRNKLETKKQLETAKVKSTILKYFQKELTLLSKLENNFHGITVTYQNCRVEINRRSDGQFIVRDYDIKSFVSSFQITFDTIKNDVILATIDAADLKELIKSVSEKYK